MKNLNEFSKEFFAKKKKYRTTRDRLQAKIDKARNELGLLERSEPTAKNIVEPLALAIQKELKAKAYYVVDIGFMSPVQIVWVSEPDMNKCKNKDEVGRLKIWIGSYDEKISIVEKDEFERDRYIEIHGNKGVKWLAKYAKQNLKKKRT
jgi:hypothetical protein